MKARIVAADERETGDERALSISAILSAMRSRPKPGSATASCTARRSRFGMALAFDYAAGTGLVDAAAARRVRDHLDAADLPTDLSDAGLSGADADRLVAHMGKDKKVRDGKITLILPRRIGEAFVMRDAPAEDSARSLPGTREQANPNLHRQANHHARLYRLDPGRAHGAAAAR